MGRIIKDLTDFLLLTYSTVHDLSSAVQHCPLLFWTMTTHGTALYLEHVARARWTAMMRSFQRSGECGKCCCDAAWSGMAESCSEGDCFYAVHTHTHSTRIVISSWPPLADQIIGRDIMLCYDLLYCAVLCFAWPCLLATIRFPCT